MKKVISFKNVDISYKNNSVINNCSFDIFTNESVAIVGKNGSGKSTIIHALCNIIPYDKGKILINNKQLTRNYHSYKKRFGIVLSRPFYIENFTVKDYWSFVAHYYKLSETDKNSRISDLLKYFNIFDYQKTQIKNLSSGFQMRVSLGASLIHNPEVLIMDEPFNNLDLTIKNEIRNLLNNLRNIKTIFIASHELTSLEGLVKRVIILKNGEITEDMNIDDYIADVNKDLDLQNSSLPSLEIQNLFWLNQSYNNI